MEIQIDEMSTTQQHWELHQPVGRVWRWWSLRAFYQIIIHFGIKHSANLIRFQHFQKHKLKINRFDKRWEYFYYKLSLVCDLEMLSGLQEEQEEEQSALRVNKTCVHPDDKQASHRLRFMTNIMSKWQTVT